MFETMSRKLEQFLYVNGIQSVGTHKNIDWLTVWEYVETDELRRLVKKYRELEEIRRSNALA